MSRIEKHEVRMRRNRQVTLPARIVREAKIKGGLKSEAQHSAYQ